MKAARIAKWRETETQEQTSSPKAQNPAHPQTDKVTFVWDGSRLLQEIHPDRTHTYIYTEADSYEPLAQITNYTDPDKAQQIHYFHCDQIGIPREMSDEAGNIVWRGQYDAWGKLLHEEKADGIHQPFRLQNQYDDPETGLHYNFFRYYDPTVGRFTQQDPIGLLGGENFYEFASNINIWIDPLGLKSFRCQANEKEGGGGLGYQDGRKICTYKCTDLQTNKSFNIISNSSSNIEGSEFCRGAVVSTRPSPLSGKATVGQASGYKPFTINTNSWWWDGWGRTADIYEKLQRVK